MKKHYVVKANTTQSIYDWNKEESKGEDPRQDPVFISVPLTVVTASNGFEINSRYLKDLADELQICLYDKFSIDADVYYNVDEQTVHIKYEYLSPEEGILKTDTFLELYDMKNLTGFVDDDALMLAQKYAAKFA